MLEDLVKYIEDKDENTSSHKYQLLFIEEYQVLFNTLNDITQQMIGVLYDVCYSGSEIDKSKLNEFFVHFSDFTEKINNKEVNDSIIKKWQIAFEGIEPESLD